MRRANKSWMAVMAAVLLVAMLAGVVWARPNDKPQAQDITRKVTLTGGDFIPAYDYNNWSNGGGYVMCSLGNCSYTAPVVFPCLPSVTVERIKLHVNDPSADEWASATLARAYPSTGADVPLGNVISPYGISGGLRTYTSPNINQVVWPSQKAFIRLYIGDTGILAYGVTVEYHRNI